jgi:hypothetical protein
MRPLQRIAIILTCLFLVFLALRLRNGGNTPGSPAPQSFPRVNGSQQHSFSNLSLSHDQCAAAFPGLFSEIEDAVSRGPFTLTWSRLGEPLQGSVKDNQVGLQVIRSWVFLTAGPTVVHLKLAEEGISIRADAQCNSSSWPIE